MAVVFFLMIWNRRRKRLQIQDHRSNVMSERNLDSNPFTITPLAELDSEFITTAPDRMSRKMLAHRRHRLAQRFRPISRTKLRPGQVAPQAQPDSERLRVASPELPPESPSDKDSVPPELDLGLFATGANFEPIPQSDDDPYNVYDGEEAEDEDPEENRDDSNNVNPLEIAFHHQDSGFRAPAERNRRIEVIEFPPAYSSL
ncbi:hypothetical protein BT96DRAFT_657086 [Gymnopus androsaceus JB14]|uniref:Uncharacterized protein n=1 Tax=Gymnopus androsaceus JB14 TaxID=1447944 RepID=A0A6A4HSE9_9AGAR|nr:hypothetical protein BT96DRAFT_657086 [Gymnopus androsaceus JB14]